MNLKEKVEMLLLQEKKRFPKAEIQDYYKLIFQSVFGAGHLIKDPRLTISYLEEEWDQTEANAKVDLYHDITLTSPIVRLNLPRCKAEKLTLSEIANAFLEGCNNFNSSLEPNFIDILHLSVDVLENEPFRLNHRELVQKFPLTLETDYPMMHHSATYRILYVPHYRVIPLENLKLGY
jgi:hypothetical protein